MSASFRGTYSRWTTTGTGGAEPLTADLIGARFAIEAKPDAGEVTLSFEGRNLVLTPDEARMIGVRLIEGAGYANEPGTVRVVG